MKITVLTYVEKDDDDTSYDVVVEQVAAALKEGGHKVSILGVHNDLKGMVSSLGRRQPDLVFNLLETFANRHFLGDVGIAGVLELLGIPYTGGGPGELYISGDKGLTKKLLAWEGLPFPDFAVFSADDELETGGHLRMPLFVKPLRNDASLGIGTDSLVENTRDMLERIVTIQRKFKDAALVEEYIEGREFYVGLLGNRAPQVFPPIEMDFSGLPEGAPRVLDAKAKWSKRSPEYKGTKAVMPELADELRARLQKVSLDAFRALRVCDYGRIDLRLTEANEIYVIEVNASCYLERDSEFATAAAASGIDYTTLINKIAALAIERRK
jgi:D-alanine-D-alanine ligase